MCQLSWESWYEERKPDFTWGRGLAKSGFEINRGLFWGRKYFRDRVGAKLEEKGFKDDKIQQVMLVKQKVCIQKFDKKSYNVSEGRILYRSQGVPQGPGTSVTGVKHSTLGGSYQRYFVDRVVETSVRKKTSKKMYKSRRAGHFLKGQRANIRSKCSQHQAVNLPNRQIDCSTGSAQKSLTYFFGKNGKSCPPGINRKLIHFII